MKKFPHTLRIERSCLKLRNFKVPYKLENYSPMCIHIYHLIFNIFRPINHVPQKSDYNAPQGWLPRKKCSLFFLFFSFLFFSFPGRVNAQPAPVIPSGDIDFRACQVSVYNSDDCYRLEFPFLFDYDGLSQPEPDEFAADQMLIQFTITGDGVFDLEATKALNANLPSLSYFSGYSTFHEQNPKVFYYLLHCNNGIQWDVPFGDYSICQMPFLKTVIIGDPGENILIQTNVQVFIQDCNNSEIVSGDSPNYTTPQPVACPADLSVELWGMPAGPVNPHEEVTPAIRIYNNGTTAVTLTDLDFRIRITDEHNTLPDPILEPNTLPSGTPPAFYHEEGDVYYYYLNSLDPDNTLAPGGFATLLAMSILPPEGLENLLGESNITVEFVRLNIDGGNCCELDASLAQGKIIFPGELPCENTPVDDVSITIAPWPDMGGITLEDCEIGFSVYVNTAQTLLADRILFELETELTGNLLLKKIIPIGLSCASMTSCPSPGGTCLECGNNTIILDYDDALNPLSISDGDGFLVVYGGLNGSLDDIIINKAAIRVQGMTEACIPDIIIDPALSQSLPMSNGCNFCNDIFLETGAYSGILEACESGFSVKLVVNGTVQFDQLTVQFTYQTAGNIVITDIATPLCGVMNNCPPAGQTQPCVSVDGNKITYQACPAFASPTQATLLDVKFTGVGCISDITFTDETKVIIPLQGECVPMDITSNSPFPVCNTCFQGMYVLGGSIETETGDGVKIEVNDPNEGIYIWGASNLNDCPGTSVGCTEEIAATNPCGEYNLNFMCSENSIFSVKPLKDNGDVLNGVTTFDLVLITKHILGTQLLDSPYKLIAADANNTKSISTFDVVAIRKLILFIEPSFPNNTSWRFVDKDHVFPLGFGPYELQTGYPKECKNVDLAVQNAALDIDFVAVKVGDVNNSANPCTNFTGGGVEDRSQKAWLYVEPDKAFPLRTGETVLFKFRLDSPEYLTAWQMGLQFDPDVLQFEEALLDYLERFSPFKHLGATEAGQGRLRLLWYAEDAKPQGFGSGQDVFTLKFKTLRPVADFQSAMALNDAVLSVAGYREDGTALSIEMANRNSEDTIKAGNALTEKLRAAAIPNPFGDELRFLISVPEDDWLEVSVFDVNGRLVASWSGETVAREKEVLFDKTKSWGDGVFTFRVQTARHLVTGKITKQ